MSFFDLRDMQDGSTVAADLCIIGAGAAGITLAREFAGGTTRVVLLESGDLEFRHRPQFLYIGENKGIENYPTTHSRFRMFGGSTTRWGGQCRPLTSLDFEKRAGIPHSGWPFGLDHLQPYYRRAQKVCSLGPSSYDPDFWLRDEATRLSPSSDLLQSIIYQFSYPSDFGRLYYDDLQTARSVDVYLNANVTEISTNSSATQVTGVSAASFNKRRLTVTAKHFIIACGGIENPRLLLSCNRVAPHGLGNDHDLVGRFFMDHPYFLTGYYDPSDPAFDQNRYTIEDYAEVGREQKFHAAFTVKERVLRDNGLNSAALYFVRRPRYKTLPEYYSPAGKSFTHLVDVLRHSSVPNRKLGTHIYNVLRRLDTIAINLGRQAVELAYPRPLLSLRAVLESTPNPDSRVTLVEKRDHFGMPRVRVDWRLNSRDRHGLDYLLNTMSKEFKRLNLGRLVQDRSVDGQNWPVSITGGKHHMGTTRMHIDPKLGVVDPDCRLHSVANLYVAGSSVFPTGGFANPTLTIVALAIRLADHLKNHMRS
jgi:choline dehydrogenase-like flavoprotein